MNNDINDQGERLVESETSKNIRAHRIIVVAVVSIFVLLVLLLLGIRTININRLKQYYPTGEIIATPLGDNMPMDTILPLQDKLQNYIDPNNNADKIQIRSWGEGYGDFVEYTILDIHMFFESENNLEEAKGLVTEFIPEYINFLEYGQIYYENSPEREPKKERQMDFLNKLVGEDRRIMMDYWKANSHDTIEVQISLHNGYHPSENGCIDYYIEHIDSTEDLLSGKWQKTR